MDNNSSKERKAPKKEDKKKRNLKISTGILGIIRFMITQEDQNRLRKEKRKK
eukprot:TRINITY_DN40_c0_g1_i1.p2 TRINITY_DN40_c0_g1~~TRINITY_DN40_c0_g1_i1.p2  ORF type:complete len:52 (+),score=8.93 TRINITY_DN40_c0_g1_i1:473-628(+)